MSRTFCDCLPTARNKKKIERGVVVGTLFSLSVQDAGKFELEGSLGLRRYFLLHKELDWVA